MSTPATPVTGFNCTSFVGCQTQFTSSDVDNSVLYGTGVAALVGGSTIIATTYLYDTGFFLFRKGANEKTAIDGMIKRSGRAWFNFWFWLVQMTFTLWLLGYTYVNYWDKAEFGGGTSIISGWLGTNTSVVPPNKPYFMYPRDTVRWWLIISTAPGVIMNLFALWAHGSKWGVTTNVAKAVGSMTRMLVIWGLTAALVLQGSIAYQSAHFTHTQYNEIPYVLQSNRTVNYHYLDYTSLMLTAAVLTAVSFLAYASTMVYGHAKYYGDKLYQYEPEFQTARRQGGPGIVDRNTTSGTPRSGENPNNREAGDDVFFYRPFNGPLLAGIVPCVAVPKVLIVAAFFSAYASAFVWAGDERLATVDTLVIYGTPILLTAIVANQNYWAFFQCCAIFFGYLWVFFLAWAGSDPPNTRPIGQRAINYGLLLTAPDQLYAFNNDAWSGSFTTAYLMVGFAVAFSILTVMMTWYQIKLFLAKIMYNDDKGNTGVGPEEEVQAQSLLKPRKVTRRQKVMQRHT